MSEADLDLRAAPGPPPAFSGDDAQRAYDTWGANCGPGALAAVLGLTLDQIRPHMGDFERKGYTNPMLMFAALRSLGVSWHPRPSGWPDHGLARVQWEGPWTRPGVPIKARYWHTHWVASRCSSANEVEIFDINAIYFGGWLPSKEWELRLVPWLLSRCEPKANGGWHLTHRLELRAREFPSRRGSA